MAEQDVLRRWSLLAFEMEAVSKLSPRSPSTLGLVEAITFLITGIPCIPPRVFEVIQPVRKPMLAYSDASWPDPVEAETNPPRLGCLFLELDGATAFTAKLTNQRESNISCAQKRWRLLSRCTPSATRLANQQILWFVDSLGAMSSLIRGSARPEDVGHIASMQATLAAQLSTQVWCAWLDSASNPSDGLCRVGADCPLCKRNGWPVQEIVPDWDSLYSQYGRVYLPICCVFLRYPSLCCRASCLFALRFILLQFFFVSLGRSCGVGGGCLWRFVCPH